MPLNQAAEVNSRAASDTVVPNPPAIAAQSRPAWFGPTIMDHNTETVSLIDNHQIGERGRRAGTPSERMLPSVPRTYGLAHRDHQMLIGRVSPHDIGHRGVRLGASRVGIE